MGSEKLLVSTAIVLIVYTFSVYGQARVEYCNQPYGAPIVTSTPVVSSAPIIQATPQLVVPTVIRSNVQPYDMYSQDLVPNVPNFGYGGDYPGFFPGMPGPMPPIIVEDGDDDNWHHLLYFLLFAMRNRGCGGGSCGGYGGGCNSGCGGGCGGGCGYGGGYDGYCGGCGGSCGGGCGGYGGSCGCGGCYDGYSGGCGGGCGCGSCGCPYGVYNGGGVSYIPYPIAVPLNSPFGYPADASIPVVEEPPSNGANEINLIIRTDSSGK